MLLTNIPLDFVLVVENVIICNSAADSAVGTVCLHLLFDCLYIENQVTMRKVFVT
jgi:hypothetical protein